MLRVITWSDDRGGADLAERAATLHPHGVAATLAGLLEEQLDGASLTASGLHESEDGLPERALAAADVLVWWGHEAHDAVADATVDRVQRHVLEGLGLVVLHSGHHSKIFRRLMGTSCNLAWRESDDEELMWTIDPSHPIAAGVEQPVRLPQHEMYGEPFDIPAPDAVVFVSSFSGGEVFRSGCCFTRGSGRVFYFSVGHETFPVYEDPQVRRVIGNGVRWALAPRRPGATVQSTRPAIPWWHR